MFPGASRGAGESSHLHTVQPCCHQPAGKTLCLRIPSGKSHTVGIKGPGEKGQEADTSPGAGEQRRAEACALRRARSASPRCLTPARPYLPTLLPWGNTASLRAKGREINLYILSALVFIGQHLIQKICGWKPQKSRDKASAKGFHLIHKPRLIMYDFPHYTIKQRVNSKTFRKLLLYWRRIL